LKGYLMYSKEQIDKAWRETIEASKVANYQMTNSQPTARDTQSALNNAVTYIGVGIMNDSLPGIKDMFYALLEGPEMAEKIKQGNMHDKLTRLGLKQ